MRVWIWPYKTNDALVESLKSSNLLSYQSVLIQIFSGSSDRSLLQSIASTLHTEVPEATIIGATTAGEIDNGTMNDDSILISVSAFEHVTLTSIHLNGSDSYSLGQRVAQSIVSEDTKCIIMFADGIKCNGEEILKGFNDDTHNDIVISGGMSGDNYRFLQTYLIHGTEVFDGGVVAVALSGCDLNVFHHYNLSWRPIGRQMVITKVEGNRIYEIDNKPILDIYGTYLGKEVIAGMPDSAIEFPLLFLQGGVMVARSMIAVMEDGSILYAGDIPLGEKVRFGIGNSSLFDKGIHQSYELSAKASIEALFVYSCAGRKSFLGKTLENEFRPLSKIAPLSGFFTYGEFYHSLKGNKLLNITTTILGLSESSSASHVIESEYTKQNEKKDLSFNALTNLVDISTSELEQEINEHLKTNSFLNQYKEAIEKAFIYSKTDPRGIITEVNDNFCTVSGYTRNELLGKSHNIVRHPDMPHEIFKELWSDISDGKTWQGIIKNRKRDGSNYYVKSTIFPMFDEKDEIIEYIGLREDITPIEIAKQKAEEADQIKTNFMANMSHEIRTPLNGIVGFLDLLSKSSLDSKQERYLSVINKSIKTLMHIVDDILDFSKIKSGKIDLELININPYNELNDLAALFLLKAQEKEIDYALTLDNHLHECLITDIQRLKQVISNITDNAIKFTPHGGKVRINVNVLNDTPTQQLIKFTVTDTGIGIQKEKLESIFDKFSQADISATRQFGGMGLGLSIAHTLVSLMGGVLSVESEEGKGSRFYFQITAEKCSTELSAEEIPGSVTSDPYLVIPGQYNTVIADAAEALSLDETVIERLFEKFILSASEEIQKLNTAIQNSDYDAIYQCALKLDGASSTLRLTAIHNCTKEIENHALKKDTDYRYDGVAKTIAEHLSALSKTLSKELK